MLPPLLEAPPAAGPKVTDRCGRLAGRSSQTSEIRREAVREALVDAGVRGVRTKSPPRQECVVRTPQFLVNVLSE